MVSASHHLPVDVCEEEAWLFLMPQMRRSPWLQILLLFLPVALGAAADLAAVQLQNNGRRTAFVPHDGSLLCRNAFCWWQDDVTGFPTAVPPGIPTNPAGDAFAPVDVTYQRLRRKTFFGVLLCLGDGQAWFQIPLQGEVACSILYQGEVAQNPKPFQLTQSAE